MHVIHMITLRLEDLCLPHEIIAITLRPQFAGATWTITGCVGLLRRVMSLALATTALMTQLHMSAHDHSIQLTGLLVYGPFFFS